MKQAMWKALDEPLDWWFYAAVIGAGVGASTGELGLSPGALCGGLIGGVVGLLILCSIRRFLVGHWR